jgi:hypothetical protein
MTNLSQHTGHAEQAKTEAAAYFAPLLLKEALQRLCQSQTTACLDAFEKAMVDRIDRMQDDFRDFDTMKEIAIADLYAVIRDVREHPETKQSVEDVGARRTQGRSENPETLEQQLQKGLEDSFPASDPPAVVSTSISGGSEKLVGVEEVLRRKREAQTNPGSD